MNFIHLEEIDSTNTYVKTRINELLDMTVVYADRQTFGRGRLDRKWTDTGEDNLYMTILLKPSNEFREVYSNLTQYLSVVLSKTLESYGVVPQIKWPNDVLINGEKIAGILCETSIRGSSFQGLALGLGVNLNSSEASLSSIDKPATSLSKILNKKIDKIEFLHALLDNFCLLYDRFINEGFVLIKDEYVKRASFLEKEIRINVLGEIHLGKAINVTDAGALVLEENNIKNTFLIGDII